MTVLNSYPSTDATIETILAVIMILGLMCLVSFIIELANKGDEILIILLLVGAGVFVISGALGLAAKWYVNPDILVYQVTLDDDYSAKDLLESYDILQIEGEIYTIQEKSHEKSSENTVRQPYERSETSINAE